MIQSVEHLHAELQLESLRQWENLDETEIEVPVVRRGKDVSAGAILTGCG